jgi:hypothetical protein
MRGPNDQVEQLAANTLTIPQDVIASLLQRLVRHLESSYSLGFQTHSLFLLM